MSLKNRLRCVAVVSTLTVSGLLAGCVTNPTYGNAANDSLSAVLNTLPGVLQTTGGTTPVATANQMGTVMGVQQIQMQPVAVANNNPLGGLASAALGNLGQGGNVGSGDFAQIAAAVATAAMQNSGQMQTAGAGTGYRVTVRLDSGQYNSFDFAQYPNLRNGDRVHVRGGQLYR